jgi:hypothetical protein
MDLSCPALRAVVGFTPLAAVVSLSFARDARLRLDFALVIGISLGCAATIAATTEAPPQRTSRRGRIPKRSQRLEPATLPLCLLEKASPFRIILLLVERELEHPRIKLAALVALTNVRFRG